jgi:hypothetical protein
MGSDYDKWRLETPVEYKERMETCQYCGKLIGIFVKLHEKDCEKKPKPKTK